MHLASFNPSGLAPGVFVQPVPAQPHLIDVSAYAHSSLMFGDVALDAEAFGVAVTRRPDASIDNLNVDERGRLLDLLWHAQKVQMECIEGQRTFSLWTISSDARDMQPRNLYLTMRRHPGRFVITLAAM